MGEGLTRLLCWCGVLWKWESRLERARMGGWPGSGAWRESQWDVWVQLCEGEGSIQTLEQSICESPADAKERGGLGAVTAACRKPWQPG